MKDIIEYDLPIEERQVDIVHILKDGQVIMAKKEYKNSTATKIKAAIKPKADIDFEKELWSVANELRGAVAENQYKDYVLSLIFLKHMSERYEVRRDELQNQLNDRH